MPTLTRPALARRLKLSETRIAQLLAEGVLKRTGGRFDLAESAVALLLHQRSDHESRQIRVRYQAAQSLAVEMRVQRQLKRLVHFDEIRFLFRLFLEEAHKAAAGVPARVFAEASLKLSDLDAKLVAGYVEHELRSLISSFQMTIDELLKIVRDETFPSD